jgi:cytoskeletal protein CcmA (bactofilin family)
MQLAARASADYLRQRYHPPRARHGRCYLSPTTPPSSRRFTDVTHPSTTVIGRGTHIVGNVASSDPVDIRGVLEGDCQTSAHCIVREGARVLGNIDAVALLVAGEVDAGVLQAEKVEVRASAKVLATIRARVVAIADGAFFQGEVEIEGARAASGPPLLKDRRKGEPEDP